MASPAPGPQAVVPPPPRNGRELVARSLRVSWWVWLFAAALGVALAVGGLVLLDYVHIISAVLWTGTDLFMGFVVGPILRRVEPPLRRAVLMQLMPRMLFYMPVIAATTTTAGWYLAHRTGIYFNPRMHGWLVAALGVSLLMFVQGIGLLLPTNLRVYWELQRERPDFERVRRWMRGYMGLTAWQGILQLLIIFVMVHFVV